MSETKGERRWTGAQLRAAADNDLENFLVASTPGGIKAQESRGQADLNAAGNLLPKRLLYAEWSEIEAMGIKRLGGHDDLFERVEFPPGWSMRPTDHSMWSDVVDETGRVRLQVFYKAAFYDRDAHFWPKREESAR